MEVVRPEAQPARAVVADRDREARDLFWPRLVRDIHEVDVLARAFAVGLDRLVGDDEQLSVSKR